MANFGDYFKESMASFPLGGLPVPATGFETATKAAETIGLLAAALGTLGPGATVASLAGASGIAIVGAGAAVAGAMLATVYVGWCIGACIYACGRLGLDSGVFRDFQRLYSYKPGSSNLAYVHSMIAKGGRGNAQLLSLAATA
jgi:hypothetical protein